MKIQVICVSDRAAAGVYKDETGPAICKALEDAMQDVHISYSLVSDDPQAVREAFERSGESDIIISVGGTGIGPRDNTPEILEEWGERLVPGIAEMLRLRSLEQTEMAVLSRLTAVQRGSTLAIALPGSVRAALFCVKQLIPLLPHAISMMAGGDHPVRLS